MNTGLILVLTSSLFASSKDILSKKLAFNVNGTVSAFASFLYAIPFYLILILTLYLLGFEDFSLGKSFVLFVSLRALTDCLAEWMKMSALRLADISLVLPFISLSPLFLIFLSPLITGDPITQKEIISLILLVTASIILIPKKENKTKTSSKAIIIGIFAAFFMALNVCFDRLAVQEASAPLAGLSMTLLAAILLSVPFLFIKKIDKQTLASHWKGFSTRGLFEVLFMTTKLFALQYLTAPTVAGILKISLLLSILGGGVFFKEKDLLRRLLAGSLIVAGILLLI